MLSLNYENINYVMTQILKLSCASFSYVNISYVLALECYVVSSAKVMHFQQLQSRQAKTSDLTPLLFQF